MSRCTPVFLTQAPVLPPFSQHSNQHSRCVGARRDPVCVAKSFNEAVQKGLVIDFGRTVQLDRDGYLPSQSNLQIPTHLRRKLKVATDVILNEGTSKNIGAIFVRGSIATGHYLPGGKSDLDLIVLLKRPISQFLRKKLHSAVSSVARTHLDLSGADIRYLGCNGSSQQPNFTGISISTQLLLSNYSVLLYGDETEIKQPSSRQKPTDDVALDFRKDERSFTRLFENGRITNNASLQIKAIQWLCKRGLRAIADLSSDITMKHSRDLVPCYKLGTEAFPLYADFFLICLQIACANASNEFVGLSRDGFIEKGCTVARNLVEVVEELFLRKKFTFPADGPSGLYSITPSHLLSSGNGAQKYFEIFRKFFFLQNYSPTFSWRAKEARPEFLRAVLPKVKLENKRNAYEARTSLDAGTAATPLEQPLCRALIKVSQPIVYRAATRNAKIPQNETLSTLKDLMKTNHTVQCRVSPSNIFVFCRSSHEWIASQKFQPPSMVVSLPTSEAILRLQVNHSLPPLFYTEAPNEHIYIQTPAKRAQRLFHSQRFREITIAQEERMWVSTHGSVSELHYDASYSVLVQRTGSKRMIFFHPDCLYCMGIYPFGHPLHRRARVNLTHSESIVFQEFWNKCASKAVDVQLAPGDAVVFPPFWAHYTESLTDGDNELSISHTLRFV